MNERRITLAITHFNRFDYLRQSFLGVAADPRINEVTISDDCSTDGSCARLVDHFKGIAKIHIYRNSTNLDCYKNKHAAVRQAIGEWVLLFDDDNILPPEYLDALFSIDPWDQKTAYCPVEARPHFDYRALEGLTVDRSNVAEMMIRKHFSTALNTANYFFNRAEWLRVWDQSVTPNTSDAIYQNYRWLAGGNRIQFVKDMWYHHRIHDGSHYKKNVHKTGRFAAEVEQKLRAMR